MRRLVLAAGMAVALVRTSSVAQEASLLPNRAGSLKFAAIGDNGTGDQPQYDVARQMEQWRRRFGFDMVRRSTTTAAGFGQDRSFMLNEVASDDLFFRAISRTGVTVDSGVIHRKMPS